MISHELLHMLIKKINQGMIVSIRDQSRDPESSYSFNSEAQKNKALEAIVLNQNTQTAAEYSLILETGSLLTYAGFKLIHYICSPLITYV